MTDKTKPALYALTPEEHATVLAALTFYQSNLDAFGDLPEGINDIASNCDTVKPLNAKQVDKLADDLNHSGLEFGDIVNLIGDDDSDPYVAAAQRHDLLDEGTLEVDGTTIVSRGDDSGAYVMAWIWVDNADAGIEGEEEEEQP